MASEIEKCCNVVPSVGQVSMYLGKQHLLSLSIFVINNMVEVPMYRFVQQPPLVLYPDLLNPNVIIIRGNHNNLRAPRYGHLRVEESGDIIIFDAIPISSSMPAGHETRSICSSKKEDKKVEAQGVMNSAVALAQQLTKIERQRNWFIQFREGQKGRKNKYYYHLQTNVVFRSLVEIYHFIEHGKLPNHYYKGKNTPLTTTAVQGPSRKISSLITHKKVGYYDSSTKTAFRSPTPLEDAQKPDGRKRKRQHDYVDETGQLMHHDDPHRSPLYDFGVGLS